MTITLRRAPRRRKVGRSRRSATEAARWYLAVAYYRQQHMLARLEKLAKLAPRGESPSERAEAATMHKFGLSRASLRRAIKAFG